MISPPRENNPLPGTGHRIGRFTNAAKIKVKMQPKVVYGSDE